MIQFVRKSLVPVRKLFAVSIQKNELFNSFTHLIGAIAGGVVTMLYIHASINIDRNLMIAVGITGISYVFLFSSSFMHHANKVDESQKSIWLILDHSAIFIMIAGSYIGPMYIFASGGLRWGVLASVSLFAALGIILKLKFPVSPNWINVAIYAPLAVISVIPMALLWSSVDSIPVRLVPIPFLKSLLIAGLVMYGIGGMIYAGKRPDPKPEIIGFHGIFHLCILAGAGLHALALYYSIKAYPVIREFLVKAAG
jgi:hemolysin III